VFREVAFIRFSKDSENSLFLKCTIAREAQYADSPGFLYVAF